MRVVHAECMNERISHSSLAFVAKEMLYQSRLEYALFENGTFDRIIACLFENHTFVSFSPYIFHKGI